MKVYVYPADDQGCGYHRLIWPAEELQRQGHDVTVVMPKDRQIQIFHQNDEVVSFGYPPDADVLVFQRTTHRLLISAVQWLRKQGVAVVVDVDDDLAAISTGNPAYWALHPRGEREGHMHSWQHLTAICKEATLVTTSTPELVERYAGHGRGHVLQNYLAPHYLDLPRRDSDLVGYPGALHAHTDDVRVVGPAIARFVRDGGRFIIAGDPTGAGRGFGLEADPETLGVVPLSRWPRALASLGIGIAPLADTRFNRSKSWLKPLELAATGVPWVGSPRVEYLRLHRLGCGLLADRPKDWYRVLRRISQDEEARADLSAAGREVARSLILRDHAFRWWEAWERAVALQRGRSPAPTSTR